MNTRHLPASVIVAGAAILILIAAAILNALQKQKSVDLRYAQGDPLPADLPPGTAIASKYGFKIVKVRRQKYWEAATEADYRAAEAKRLGIKPEQVSVRGCYMTNPNPPTCGYDCGTGAGHNCHMWWNPESQYYHCSCDYSGN